MSEATVIHVGTGSRKRFSLGEVIDLSDCSLSYEYEPNLIRMAEDSVLYRFRDCVVPVTTEDGRRAWNLGLLAAHLGVSMSMSGHYAKEMGRGILSRIEYLDEMWRFGWLEGSYAVDAIVAPKEGK